MAENSKIEWTNNTFNPWVGCAKVSPACDHCYAEGWAKRAGTPELWQGQRRRTSAANWRQPLKWNRAAEAAGKRARVFCASLADVFDNHPAITDDWRHDLGALIRATPNLDWLLLSKRIGNAERYLPLMFPDRVPETVWLGATVCNQAEAVRDIPKLLAAPVGMRFLSAEPLLSALDLREWLTRLDLLIVGGESGSKARPMHPDWVRGLRDQCAASGTGFFFKQWGEWGEEQQTASLYGKAKGFQWSDGTRSARLGKVAAGRLLDGVEHNGEVRMEQEYFRFLITWAPHLRKVDGIPKSFIDRGTVSGHILVSDEGGLTVTSEGAAWVAEYLAQWGKVWRDHEVDLIVEDHHAEIVDFIKAGGCLSKLAKAFDCPGLALSEADIREGLRRREEERQAECSGFSEG